MMYSKILVFCFLVASLQIAAISAKKVVCYYGSWSVYRPGDGSCKVEDIDPFLCTHAIYAFVGIDQTGSIKILDPSNDVDNGGFRRFNAMKSKNPNLKTLLAVGGWNEGSENYSKMAGNPSLRTNFIISAINLMNQYGFDGFDIDWEYPAQRGGVPEDKVNFVTLIREFRQALGNGRVLSIAAGATPSHIVSSYDVSALTHDLDFINVMTYDLHASWDGVTGANAPLFSSSGVSVSQCIDAWIASGAPSSKLVMGIPVYGRTYTLANSQVNGIGVPAPHPGTPGPFTQEEGTIGYNEICLQLLTGQWVVVWDDAQKIPYAYKENQWVSYDEQRSVGVKVQYIKQRDLGGAMIWSIDTDDFRGTCGTKYPILTTIKNGLI
ncbi:hypothetical protein PPYR_05909 [Photinus pyralis]|uniref:GH18 domain-containing protein n=1 Tax=Photinus pyralis TaxID=7054 RepID=A0A5N4AW08_PHOPY|nr:acidic mammalian chitinase-like [Photinus pyralis]KAB0801555.1 hypothetical protein PPYR_05909 [Photinus pyralis]